MSPGCALSVPPLEQLSGGTVVVGAARYAPPMDWLFGHHWTPGWAAILPGLFALGGAGLGFFAQSRTSKRQIAHAHEQWRHDFDERLAQRLRELYPSIVSASLNLNQTSTLIRSSAKASVATDSGYTPERVSETRLTAHSDLATTSVEVMRVLQTMRVLSGDPLVDEQLNEIDRLLGINMSESTAEMTCRRLDRTAEWVSDNQLQESAHDFHRAVENLGTVIKSRLNRPKFGNGEESRLPRMKRAVVENPSPTLYRSELERTAKWDSYSDELLDAEFRGPAR
ncbi:hypothetical protein GCM10009570_21590 [Dietzia natronolimnaea]